MKVLLFMVACTALGQSTLIEKMKLKFKVSGRNLISKGLLGTSDPYYIVSYSNNDGKSKTKIGRSDTINSQENPDWGNVFTFDFDLSKNQYLYFHVYDEDNFRIDDTLGRVWINVADYVDKGQFINANLDKGGYLIVQSADPSVEMRSTSPGQLPLPLGTPGSETLRFKLSASDLATKDDFGIIIPGRSDPYVIITSTDGPNGNEKDVGRTSTLPSTSNPNWDDVITFRWDRNKDQRLHFKLYDDDKLRRDDKLGGAWMEVNDYVAHGQSYTILLPKQGTLTVSRA